jgi:diguanylate cyclase (GGDEF)-like protein
MMVSERLNDSLVSLAMRDFLTGLYNRRALEEICLRTRASSVRNHQPYSVFLLDIDAFKTINDKYGHTAGDRVLVEVARVLRGTVREEDFICRWGGDEFFGLLPRADEAQAVLVIQRIQDAVGRLDIVLDGEHVRLRISIGIVTDRGEEHDFHSILTRADNAMYAAKGSGGNGFQVFQAA